MSIISINDQSIDSLSEFWDTLKSLIRTSANDDDDDDHHHQQQGRIIDNIQSLVIKNAGFHGQQACRNLVKLLLLAGSNSNNSGNGKKVSSSSSIIKLHTLIIHESKLGPRGIKILVEELLLLLKKQQCSSINNINLKTLDFATCRMGHFGSESLSKYMPYASETLRNLNLSSNNLGDDGIWKLAVATNHQQKSGGGQIQSGGGLSCLKLLESLDLSYNSISDNGLSEIGRNVLPQLQHLRDVNLSNNQIKGHTIDSFVTALKLDTCRISYLDLSSNQIQPPSTSKNGFDTDTDDDDDDDGNSGSDDDDDGDEDNNDGDNVASSGRRRRKNSLPIAQILEGNQMSSLETIDLSHNLLGDDGAVDIAESLGKSQIVCLKHLSLKDNHIGDKGAGAFVDVFEDVVVSSSSRSSGVGGGGDNINEQQQQSLSSSLFLALNLDDNPDISPARINILQVLRKHHLKKKQQQEQSNNNVENSDQDNIVLSDKDNTKEEVVMTVQSSDDYDDDYVAGTDAVAATTIQKLKKEVYQLKTKMVKMEQDMNQRIQDMEMKQDNVKNELLQVIDELRIELLIQQRQSSSLASSSSSSSIVQQR